MSSCTRLFSSPNMNCGQLLGEQRLADAGGAGKDEAADRPLRVLHAGPALANRLGDGHDRLVLADDGLVQLVFHLEQPLRFRRRSIVLSGTPVILETTSADHFLIDDAVGFLGFLAPFARHGFLLLLEFVGLVAEMGGLLEVLLGDRRFLFLVELLDLGVEFLQIRRPGHGLEPNAGAGLIDHVDRLVRQAAAGDVAIGKLDRRLQRLILDLDAVMGFVTVAQTLEDLDRLAPWTAG